MGCDIHLYREKIENGVWVSADKWTAFDHGDEPEDKGLEIAWNDRAYTGRNYDFFSVLAGVRRREEPPYCFEARGLPLVVSDEVAGEYDRWSGDAHGASHLYLHELVELRGLLKDATQEISGMKDREELAALKASIASGSPDWHLLYPYCQSTNDPRQVDFKIDVPASFTYGGCLDQVIASLEGIGGDMQRIVFWFDN